MVNPPPVATVPQLKFVYQVTVPVELEAAVNVRPPAGAVVGLPKASWSWTVITLPAPAHAPAVMVREGVLKANRPGPAGPMSNATLVAPVSPTDEAVRV